MKYLLFLFAFLLLPGVVAAQTPEKFRVYLGTYTGKLSKGIYQCEIDLKDGKLSNLQLAGEMTSPSFVAIHPNQKFLYAVGEAGGKKSGVVAFAIDKKTGNLTKLNDAPSRGDGPCHLVVDASGSYVLAANYVGGSCVSIPIDKDGKLLGDYSSFRQHKGSSILPNQKGPHGHSINMDKANKFAFCADLGLDKIIIYRLEPDTGNLIPHGEFDTPAGSGPRHFAFHPDGKTAYTNGEMSMTLIAMDYDAEKGVLKQKQVITTLPKDEKRKGGSTAEVVVHPSGKFVYVSNRDPFNSIAIFAIDKKTGALTAVGHEARGVKTPRNFAIEPTGKYMLVANQSGNSVISFAIDQKTGELTPTGSSVEVGGPVCVRFMPIAK
ncbi:MAG: lactonase family protein [Planctomycetes bacterium]|nr:lactonase family protein [Planctomycetota bacterium]